MTLQTAALPRFLARFLALYVALFAAFGVASPFFAAFLSHRALQPEAIGVVLAAGTAIRLFAGPLGARLSDRLGTPRLMLVGFTAAASAIALLYLPATGFWRLLLVSVAHASVLAPINPIADALTLQAAIGGQSSRRFEYGWVRGAGSAAFILGTLLAGPAAGQFGLDAIIWLNGLLLGAAAWWAHRLPELPAVPVVAPVLATPRPTRGATQLLRLPAFRRLMLVAALIQGSHALHDGFVVIHWQSQGIGDGTIGLLWSESVAAEVVVFMLGGPWLLDRLSPAAASVLAALAGVVRWAVLAQATSTLGPALVEPLHGLTFALQHLACMRLIGAIVAPELAATAQAFYSTVAVGAATAVLTLASGTLYAHLGAPAFWLMAALCAIAIPLTRGLNSAAGKTTA